MLRKKLILMGDSSVGKTSLISRWVKGIFSDKYIATIGVKIEKKTLQIDSEQLVLQIWDLQGGSEIKGYVQAYVKGAEGCLFVADGTRPDTLNYVNRIHEDLIRDLGNIPSALAINKEDMRLDWKISQEEISRLNQMGWTVFVTSAKSGNGVESAFHYFSRTLFHPSGRNLPR